MVTQQILVLSFWVRIPAAQPEKGGHPQGVGHLFLDGCGWVWMGEDRVRASEAHFREGEAVRTSFHPGGMPVGAHPEVFRSLLEPIRKSPGISRSEPADRRSRKSDRNSPESTAGVGRRCPISTRCCRSRLSKPEARFRSVAAAICCRSLPPLPDPEPLPLDPTVEACRRTVTGDPAPTATSSLSLPGTLCCRVPDPVTAGARALPAGTSCRTPAFETPRRESLGSSGSGCRCGRRRAPWFRGCPPLSLRDSRFRSKDGECRAWMVSWNDPPEGYLRFVFLR